MNGLNNKNYNKIILNFNKLFSISNLEKLDWEKIKYFINLFENNEYTKHISIDKLLSYKFRTTNFKNINLYNLNAISLTHNLKRIVFLDGVLNKNMSDLNIDPWNIKIIYNYKYKLKNKQGDIFYYLTRYLSSKIIRINLPKNKICYEPLYILNISSGSKIKNILNIINYNFHIEIGDNSVGSVIEHYISLDKYLYLNLSYTSINVNNNSNFYYTKLLNENFYSYHFGYSHISVNNNSVINNNVIIFGSLFNKNQSYTKLNGINSNVFTNSLSLPIKNNINYINTYIEHNNKNCLSKQLHKIIVHNKSKGIFEGLIKVNKNAAKTNANMVNNNLLIDPFSKIYTDPKLEIYDDDVKCSHGSTTNNINNDQILYLQSRSLSYNLSRQLLLFAFAQSVINEIKCITTRSLILNYTKNILHGIYI
ncbi:MAG: SufD family Fe-S cluster assembly protein [Enterobacterales bacterium]